MVTKKQLYSFLDKSKETIESVFDDGVVHIWGLKSLRSFVKNAETINSIFGLTPLPVDNVIDYLLENSYLQQVKFLTPRAEKLYLWRNPSEYEIMPILRPNGYYSHLSAMYFHGLLSASPHSVYFNCEQPVRPRAGNLEQSRIDNAFRKKQRITTSRTKYNDIEYWLLNGKNTGNYGVATIKVNDSQIQVTNIERTLIDITVRPAYAGGVKSVMEGYRLAKPKASTFEMSKTLRALDYIYPYYQSIGFYMEAAGNYSAEDMQEFLNFGTFDYDFYLDYAMKDPEYSQRWKVYYPKDIFS